MKKDFNDFMKEMDSKDWSSIADHVANNHTNSYGINLELFVTVLREYHDWLNKED